MPPLRNSYEAVPDVKTDEEDCPPFVETSPPRRRRRKSRWCSSGFCMPLAFVLFVGSVVGAIMVVMRSTVHLEPEIEAAKAMVRVDEVGIWSVTQPDAVPPDMNYAELADRMLPPWYEALLMAIDDKLHPNKMKPDNVAYTRKVFLQFRSLLDAFSPVYDEYSLWDKLRHIVDKGYEKVGKFQDLDHSGIDYDDNDVQERMADVLNWKIDFAKFQQQHHVRLFVYRGADPTQCARHKSSHLFWFDQAEIPCGGDPAEDSVQYLGRIQLTNAALYWQTVQFYDTVIPLIREEQFHNLRKELRIFLDEYELFGNVMLRNPDQDALATLFEAQTMLGELNDIWTARQIYVTEGTHFKQQQKLSVKIDETWAEFQVWAKANDLGALIQSVLDMLI